MASEDDINRFHFRIDDEMHKFLRRAKLDISEGSVGKACRTILNNQSEKVLENVYPIGGCVEISQLYTRWIDRNARTCDFDDIETKIGGDLDHSVNPTVQDGVDGMLGDISDSLGFSNSDAARLVLILGFDSKIEVGIHTHGSTPIARKWQDTASSIEREIDSFYNDFDRWLKKLFRQNREDAINRLQRYPGKARDFAWHYDDQFKDTQSYKFMGDEIKRNGLNDLEDVLNSVSDTTGIEIEDGK